MALAFLENQRVLARRHTEARTDSLTGLGNRRSLMADLELQIELPSLAAPARAAHVRPRRLQGVQRRLRPSRRRRAARAARGTPRRRGRRPRATPTGSAATSSARWSCPDAAGRRAAARGLLGGARRARRGLRGRPPHTASVLLPEEATTPTEALQLADRRMYARKGGRRMSAGRQSRDVLLRTLLRAPARPAPAPPRRRPTWRWRSGASSTWAREELDEVARAAELHDVGKIADSRRDPRQARPARRDRVGASCAATR